MDWCKAPPEFLSRFNGGELRLGGFQRLAFKGADEGNPFEDVLEQPPDRVREPRRFGASHAPFA